MSEPNTSNEQFSRREAIQVSAASLAGLALGSLPGLAQTPQDKTKVRVVELAKEHAELLEKPTLLPTPGYHPHGGCLTAVAGNPEVLKLARNHKNPNFKPDGSRNPIPGRDRPPVYKVFLLCRTIAGDSGARPLPPTLVYWESPDIWVEGPAGAPDQAKAGVQNTVKVHVWNLGLTDCYNATVDLFWCNPGAVNAASAHPIGSQTVELVSGQHKVLSFTWTPVRENDGHECLVAQVYDLFQDPVAVPFAPLLDRHVAQHNVTVLPAKGQKKAPLHFFVPNLSKQAADLTLEVERLADSAVKVLGMALGAKKFHAAKGGTAGLTTPTVHDARPSFDQAAWKLPAVFRETQGAGSAKEQQQVAHTLHVLAAPGQKRTMKHKVVELKKEEKPPAEAKGPLEVKRDLKIPPGKELALTLAATPSNEAAGAVEVYRVVERVKGKITGGVTLVVTE
jgi:hypothetical protein